MSIRKFLKPDDQEVMFISDLLRDGSTKAQSEKPSKQSANIYELVNEHSRTLENERFTVQTKKRKLEEMQAEANKLTKRYQIHEKNELQRQCNDLSQEIQHIESGSKIDEFLNKAKPYLNEYQNSSSADLLNEH